MSRSRIIYLSSLNFTFYAMVSRRCFLLRIKGLITLTCQLQAETLDINQIFTYWQELIETAKEAKLFPIQEFSNDLINLMKAVPDLGNFPIFRNLCSQADEIVAVRAGKNRVAKNCQERAQTFFENKQIILALKELHNARVKWFSGDTLRESLFATLTIAECFLQLKMVYAAKYYVLGVLYIIQSQDDVNIKVLLPRCILTLMRIDFLAGSWFNNVRMLEC